MNGKKYYTKYFKNSMPSELLISLQINAEVFSDLIKLQAAIALSCVA
jgi:hypothetical protein